MKAPKPNKELRKLSKKYVRLLLRSKLSEINQLIKVENDLLIFCFNDPEINSLISTYGIKYEDYRKIYDDLISAGAGQWKNKHWVAISALAYPNTLRYYLDNKNEDIKDIAYNLILYFNNEKDLGGNSDVK